MTLLETERLTLRAFTEADADDFFEMDSDPEVMRFAGPPWAADAAGYRRQIRERLLPYYAACDGFGYWAAVERAMGVFVGWISLRPGLDYRFAAEAGYGVGDYELGYRLKRSAWGRGYATEGSRALVRRAFADPRVRRVVSCALAGNAASIRVMQKVGLKPVGLFPTPGYDQSSVVYALGRVEINIGQAPAPSASS